MKFLKEMTPSSKDDDETYTALTNYFWGKENGVVIELGGLDGQHMSVSRKLLQVSWHRVIMEANPVWAAKGPKNSPDATFVHGAVCDADVVHYIQHRRKGAASSAIGEFMSDSFFQRVFPAVYKASKHNKDWTSVKDWKEWSLESNGKVNKGYSVFELSCLQIHAVLQHLKTTDVNWFMLDVNGGELNILQSIDWDKVRFDVLTVETEQKHPNPGNRKKVEDFVISKGYVLAENKGRNSWFRHPDFVPSVKPTK